MKLCFYSKLGKGRVRINFNRGECRCIIDLDKSKFEGGFTLIAVYHELALINILSRSNVLLVRNRPPSIIINLCLSSKAYVYEPEALLDETNL